MQKVALFGGTFDPIHVGHLIMAQMACEKMKLDQVIFIPSYTPPHKTNKRLFTPDQRLKMVRLAVKNHPYFKASDYEFKKEGKSFSVDTVRYYQQKFSAGAKLYFIVGGDAIIGLDSWRDIDKICEIVEFICVNRPGYEATKNERVQHILTTQGIDVSSTQIRQRIQQQKPIQYLVPDNVLRYIEQLNSTKN